VTDEGRMGSTVHTLWAGQDFSNEGSLAMDKVNWSHGGVWTGAGWEEPSDTDTYPY
jgi:hypothetical protein